MASCACGSHWRKTIKLFRNSPCEIYFSANQNLEIKLSQIEIWEVDGQPIILYIKSGTRGRRKYLPIS